MGVAAETDEGYMRAAADTLKRANWGMFCIPGIATLEHVDLAANYGMHFIRVGTDVTEVAESKRFIERAKKHGMFVCSNFMKSYACTPEEFAPLRQRIDSFASEAGRDPADIGAESGVGIHGRTEAEWLSILEARKNTGVTHLCMRTLGAELPAKGHLDALARIHRILVDEGHLSR